MPILPIVHYPEAVLLAVGRPVEEFGAELVRLFVNIFGSINILGKSTSRVSPSVTNRVFACIFDQKSRLAKTCVPTFVHSGFSVGGAEAGIAGLSGAFGIISTLK